MISNREKGLIHRGANEAGIDPIEYRETLLKISGCYSSTDAAFTHRHVDKIMAYFEAICWNGRDRNELPLPGQKSVFIKRGYWQGKNPSEETSRDRWNHHELQAKIDAAEAELQDMGFHPGYIRAIQKRLGYNPDVAPDLQSMARYASAIAHTVKAKQAKIEQPF
jgi:hypothetical protein